MKEDPKFVARRVWTSHRRAFLKILQIKGPAAPEGVDSEGCRLIQFRV